MSFSRFRADLGCCSRPCGLTVPVGCVRFARLAGPTFVSSLVCLHLRRAPSCSVGVHWLVRRGPRDERGVLISAVFARCLCHCALSAVALGLSRCLRLLRLAQEVALHRARSCLGALVPSLLCVPVGFWFSCFSHSRYCTFGSACVAASRQQWRRFGLP